ncbi:MAG: DUF4890 domain-containing protein [Chromatiales bacterium]|nr:DUF4890 domain-containing protein [Chromatiales bacterium]
MFKSLVLSNVKGWSRRLLMLGLLTVSTLLAANDMAAQNAEELSELITEQMVDELSLNTDQTSRTHEINQQFIEKIQALRQTGQSQRLGQLKGLRQIAKERDEAMNQILTDQQFSEYQELVKQHRAELREMLKERRQAPSGQ